MTKVPTYEEIFESFIDSPTPEGCAPQFALFKAVIMK
jgi:hypothetical protein